MKANVLEPKSALQTQGGSSFQMSLKSNWNYAQEDLVGKATLEIILVLMKSFSFLSGLIKLRIVGGVVIQ